ncbi:MAG: AzlC family ABC transporter permease [Bacillota bacterium]
MFGKEFALGSKKAIPIAMGYFPLGLAFGVLARETGLTLFEATGMSFMVFAGAGQFIAIGFLKAGADILTIMITTFLVNSRLFLMSMVFQPKLKEWPRLKSGIIAAEITDETFVVANDYYSSNEPSWPFHLGLNITSHLAWIASTALGAGVGNLVKNPESLGLNFALPAMFIALLVGQVKNKRKFMAAIVAGILSLLFKIFLTGNWNILLATLIAATLGVTMEKWIKK